MLKAAKSGCSAGQTLALSGVEGVVTGGYEDWTVSRSKTPRLVLCSPSKAPEMPLTFVLLVWYCRSLEKANKICVLSIGMDDMVMRNIRQGKSPSGMALFSSNLLRPNHHPVYQLPAPSRSGASTCIGLQIGLYFDRSELHITEVKQ